MMISEACAGLRVDVWVDAALADHAKVGQPFEQGCPDLCALAEQNQYLRVLQARCEPVDILEMVVPDRDGVAVQLVETVEGPQRVVIIVKNGNFHAWFLRQRTA